MDAIKIEQAKADYKKIVSFIEDGSPLPPETDPYWEVCVALDRLGGFIADIDGAKNTEQQLQPDKFQEHCTHPSNYIICGAYSDGICKSPKGTCRLN